MSALEVRSFERADLDVLVPPDRRRTLRHRATMHGLTLSIAGTPVAVGGLVMIGSRWWTFAEITEPARRPMTLHRLVLGGLAAADRCGINRIYGYCDVAYPRAQAWIESMGFRPVRDDERDRELRLVEGFVKAPAWVRERKSGH